MQDLIKKIRTHLNLSQAEFAEQLNVSFATVNRWECGKFKPTTKLKRKLAPYFEQYGIEVDE